MVKEKVLVALQSHLLDVVGKMTQEKSKIELFLVEQYYHNYIIEILIYCITDIYLILLQVTVHIGHFKMNFLN